MSTSVLYHGFGIRGYRYQRTDYEDGVIFFTVTPAEEPGSCPKCGARSVQRRGYTEREWQTVPIGSRRVFVRLNIPRVCCQRCGAVSQMPVPFAVPHHSYTRSFQRYVLGLCRCMTVKDVAEHVGVTWWKVKDIEKRYLDRKFSKPKLKDLRWIGIDEISIGKGHRYITVVLDLKTGAIVYVGEGKAAKTLEPFWKRLKASHAKIEAVATDMSQAYISAVRENLPDTALVFDRFHIMKLFNDGLSNLRRDLYREATDKLQKDVLKGTRWLLLKNEENLDDWCARARASGIQMLQKMANTLAAHRRGLLAWYQYPISTGPLEGTNNKITTLKRQAYGFRDQESFRLKLYALHLTRYQLIG